VFYKGTTTSCLGITTGTNLQDIIQAFDAAICDLPTPSGGNTYVVSGTSNQIVVTSATAGTQTTYTVALSPTITTHLTTIDSSIVTLGNCTATSIQELTTSSSEITVTPNGALGCGTTWSIDYTPPSGTPIYDCIIHNDTSTHNASGVGTEELTIFTEDLVTRNLLTTKDNIIIVAEGQYAYDEIGSQDSDTIIVNILNGASIRWTMRNKPTKLVAKYGYRLEVTYTVTGATTGRVTAFWFHNNVSNGTEAINSTGLPRTIFSKDVTGMDYTNFSVQVQTLNESGLGATYTFLNHLQVEVRKYI
tara:strand:+ start:17394 stop:18305 length:912 start_codon:yes stop_codon:yes gene_type:complete